jgi:hypothetical protein
MPCRIYKLDFQEKNLNREIRGSNPGLGSNFSLENLIKGDIEHVTLLQELQYFQYEG